MFVVSKSISALLRVGLVCGFLLLGSVTTSVGYAQTTHSNAARPVNHLSLPEHINFAGERYHLAWSGRNDTVIKQEYVRAGERPQAYTRMLIVELRAASATAQQFARTMADGIDQRNQDPFATQSMVVTDDGEVYLEFALSEPSADGGLVFEWNVYRMVDVVPNVFATVALSRRPAGSNREAINALIDAINSQRLEDIRALSEFPFNAIRIRTTGSD